MWLRHELRRANWLNKISWIFCLCYNYCLPTFNQSAGLCSRNAQPVAVCQLKVGRCKPFDVYSYSATLKSDSQLLPSTMNLALSRWRKRTANHGSSGSGYIHRRSQSTAMSTTEAGRAQNKLFKNYRRPPLSLQSYVFMNISLGGHDNHV